MFVCSWVPEFDRLNKRAYTQILSFKARRPAHAASCLARVMAEAAKGAIAVAGNHDQAVGQERETMTSDAEFAMAWTRGQLGTEAREFSPADLDQLRGFAAAAIARIESRRRSGTGPQ